MSVVGRSSSEQASTSVSNLISAAMGLSLSSEIYPEDAVFHYSQQQLMKSILKR